MKQKVRRKVIPFAWARSFLILLVSICSLFIFSNPAFALSRTVTTSHSAKSSPLVYIVSDVTNQGCKKTFHNVKTNKISTVACPPGTALIATTVTESQAEAQHESFVVALPPHVSDARKQQFRLQIQQLMREKRSQLQANIVEQTPCYDGGETMQIASGVNTGGDSIGDLVEYGLSPDCTRVLLDYASLSGWSIPNALYWGVSKYAGQQWGENCTFIGNGTVTHTYDANEPAGYDFVFYLLDQGQGSGDGGGLVCEGDDNSPIFGLGPLD